MRRTPFFAAALLIASHVATARADVRLPKVVGSHMVLQQKSDVAIFGFAAPGEAISVAPSWTKETFAGKAGADGRFKVMVKTPEAGGPYAIDVKGTNTIHLEDVLIGEVWLCGGQSNMEWAFAYGGVLNLEKERAAANDSQIRFFDAPNRASPKPEDDCAGIWAACTPASVDGFSCCGYFFARELRKALNVPIGLIGVNWGGTVAEAWVSEEGLAAFPQFNPALARVKAARALGDAGEATSVAKLMAPWWAALDAEDVGAKNAWMAAAFDDSGWETASLPGLWSGELEKFDGIVWYRRSFELPATLAGKPLVLSLGAIDDMDQTFLDGVKVGGVEIPAHWTDARRYEIPAQKATAGRHVLAIRVVDTGYGGGLAGAPEDLEIGLADGSPVTLAGEWRMRIGLDAKRFPKLPEGTLPLNPNLPTVLWNGLVQPVLPFSVRGALWYQGESNRGRAAEYSDLMPALIADWRARFGCGDFPFLFVQIAPFQYDGSRAATAELRQAQVQTLRVPNTGMVVTMDIGDAGNIHPENKQEVGRRLSLWALAMTYGRSDVECCGPLFDSFAVEGEKIRVRFTHAKGLIARGVSPTLFEVAGDDGNFVGALASVDGETVVVSSPKVKAPKDVRFGFTDADAVNLFNGAGLPASPFCRIRAAER